MHVINPNQRTFNFIRYFQRSSLPKIAVVSKNTTDFLKMALRSLKNIVATKGLLEELLVTTAILGKFVILEH